MVATPSAIVELWNTLCEKHTKLRKVRVLSRNRKAAVKEAISEVPDLEDWEVIIDQVSRDKFLMGHNDRAWVATFDYLFRKTKDNYIRLLEEGLARLEEEEKVQMAIQEKRNQETLRKENSVSAEEISNFISSGFKIVK